MLKYYPWLIDTVGLNSDWHWHIEILRWGESVLFAPRFWLFSTFVSVTLASGDKWQHCGLLWPSYLSIRTVYIQCSPCFIVSRWTHFKHQGSFFSAFVEFHLPVFTSSFSSAVTIETLHPYQQGAFGCRAHWLSQERDTDEQVFPWHDFGTNVARKAFTWLWQCFLGSRRPTVGDTSTRFVTTGWRLRQSEIQLGEIHSCNWNEFTWETAALRCLLAVNSPCLPACT